MKLSEIFHALSAGELSQISMGNMGKGIQPEDQRKLLSSVNLGLKALYKRFTIKRGEVTIKLTPGIFTYVLDSKYSQAAAMEQYHKAVLVDPNTPVPSLVGLYIHDLDRPFKDDINKVEVLHLDSGFTFPIDDPVNRMSAKMLDQLTMRLPVTLVNQSADLFETFKTEDILVSYRTKALDIIKPGCGMDEFFEPSEVDVELPDMYLEALIYFVASRVMNPIGMNEEFHAGNNYAAKYEEECQRLEGKDLNLTDGATNWGVQRKGFV